MWISLASLVIELDGLEVVVVFHDQFDWLATALAGVPYRMVEQFIGGAPAIDGDDLHAGSKTGQISGRVHKYVADAVFSGGVDADRVPGVNAMVFSLPRVNVFVGLLRVLDFVAARRNSCRSEEHTSELQAFTKKRCPIERLNRGEQRDQLVEV